MRILTCEQVSDGHPDKICDQISDAVVTDCLQHDPDSRVAVECLLKDNHLIIAGELTSKHEPDYKALVDQVFDRIGRERLGYPPDMDIQVLVKKQSPDIAMGVDTGGAGDQGVMFGYASLETPEMLPIPFAVATRFLQKLRKLPYTIFKADAKSQVSFDYDTGEITAFLCSVQHSPDVEIEEFRPILEELMVETADEYMLGGDFLKLVNPTGRFVIGGSFADCGVTGRKVCCDSYGSLAHVGGGAFSGKDPSKVDRSAAYASRYVAKNIVAAGLADKCLVQLAYAIGIARPVSVMVDTYGTGKVSDEKLAEAVNKVFDLRPTAIIRDLDLRKPIYRKLAAYGHMGRTDLGVRWEDTDRVDALLEAVK